MRHLALALLLATPLAAQAPNTAPPDAPVKLVFVHHSTGENWLRDDDGGLGAALGAARWFVSDTNYDWGPADADTGSGRIGDHTDIGNWWQWFSGPHRDTYLAALLAEGEPHSEYARSVADPGGPNRVVLFKSCFPNARLAGPAGPIPPIGSNPLRGQDASSEAMTLANAKGIYADLLGAFAARPDVLFVAVVNPPLGAFDTDADTAANARALADWLVNDWLRGYAGRNVAVFDFFNVLTSNGGSSRTNDPEQSDVDAPDGNHHRVRDGAYQHLRTVPYDMSAYAAGGDSHPTRAGNQKATAEFVPLLNAAYHCWQGSGGCPAASSGGCAISSCSASAPAAAAAGESVTFRATLASSGCSGAPAWDWDFGDGSAHASAQEPAHAYAAGGTYAWSVTATLDGQSCTRGGSIAVAGSGPSPAHAYAVPAAAHSAGIGTLWRTDLAAVNRSASPASLTVTFRPASGESATRSTSVPASGAREWPDVLGSLFGYGPEASASGTLLVGSDQPLLVTSRTYNQGSAGTYGGYLPGLGAGAGLAPGQVGLLPHLKKNASFRTNVGVTNLGTATTLVSVTLHGAAGTQVGTTRVLTVAPGALVQDTDVFVLAGAGGQEIAYATVAIASGPGPVWAYASVIDAATGDPTIVPLSGP